MDTLSFTPQAVNPYAHLGSAVATAYSARAPQDEVADAGLEVLRQFAGAESMYPQEAQVSMRDYHRLQEAERLGDRLLSKALTYLHPDAAEAKARTDSAWTVLGGGGLYLQKPGITFDGLRGMSQRIEIARALHMTRKRQVGAFSQPSEKDDQKGFRIKHVDPGYVMTDDEKAYTQWLTQFLTAGGRDFRPWMRNQNGRRTLRTFLQEGTDESLTHDNVAVELVPLANGVKGLDSYYLRDGGTFFHAGHNDQGIYAYQTLVGLAEAHFSHDELAIFQRNVSPWIEARGYGRSELEASVDTMTSFLQAISYTREGMDNNSIPRGILTVYGQFDRRTQELFQNSWQAKVRGVKNRFGLPVLFSRNGQAASTFTSTGPEFSEMAFAKWIGLQTSIFCAVYGADPKEINLDGFSSGNSSPLGGDDTAERLAAAKDKGLEPLLSDWEGFLSDDILARFDPRYRLVFTGLDPMEAAAKRAREEKVSTINELRTSLGMEKHPLGWFGELPADPGAMAAEFQRLNAVLTVDEARKVWGGLEAYPDPSVGAAPMNPSLGALFQAAVAPPQPDPNGEDPFAAMQDGQGGDGEDGGGEAPEPGAQHKEMADRLRDMKPGA